MLCIHPFQGPHPVNPRLGVIWQILALSRCLSLTWHRPTCPGIHTGTPQTQAWGGRSSTGPFGSGPKAEGVSHSVASQQQIVQGLDRRGRS